MYRIVCITVRLNNQLGQLVILYNKNTHILMLTSICKFCSPINCRWPNEFRPKRFIQGVLLNPAHPTLADTSSFIDYNKINFQHFNTNILIEEQTYYFFLFELFWLKLIYQKLMFTYIRVYQPRVSQS